MTQPPLLKVWFFLKKTISLSLQQVQGREKQRRTKRQRRILLSLLFHSLHNAVIDQQLLFPLVVDVQKRKTAKVKESISHLVYHVLCIHKQDSTIQNRDRTGWKEVSNGAANFMPQIYFLIQGWMEIALTQQWEKGHRCSIFQSPAVLNTCFNKCCNVILLAIELAQAF